MRRLYSENVTAKFAGNVLSEDNWNDVIDALMSSKEDVMATAGDVFTFADGVTVTLTGFDENGNFTGFTIDSRTVTQRAPLYPNLDRTVYRNPDITAVDTASDYTLLNEDGVALPRAEYALAPDGTVTFAAGGRVDDYLMVDGLAVISTLTVTVTRDATSREITAFTADKA
jgi:hypothetical protein